MIRRHLLMGALSAFSVVAFVVVIACAETAKKDATPEPQAAPAAAGCGKDSDCHGDRICDRGQCVSPR